MSVPSDLNAGHGILVLGAGVLGLTTALQLAPKGYRNVTVIAKNFSGDHHPDYTSSWAGANYVPISQEGSEHAQWDLEAWQELSRLAKEAPEAGIWMQSKHSYYRDEDMTRDSLNPWWEDLVEDFRFLSKEEVPDFAHWGTFYRTVCLDPSLYLDYLQGQCLSLGVVFRRVTIGHILQAFHEGAADKESPEVVVNCTGLWASKLGGVMDDKVVPICGQLVVGENESHGMFGLSGDETMREELRERTYIMNRPAGGTIIGDSSHLSWDSKTDLDLAKRMMKRAIKVCPRLVPEGAGIEALRVVRHQVGLRPVRYGGPRVETETLHDTGEFQAQRMRPVVHCYGSGSFGFQSSYGMANKAVRLVGEILSAGLVN